MAQERTHAVVYLRTSSTANVAGDSEPRQQEAIATYADRAGFQIVASYWDAGVSGVDAVQDRPGFAALLDHIEGNGVRVVLVEDASRLARDLITQELAIVALQARGVRVLASNGDDLTATDDPMKVAMRQIAGAFAQLEKARLVAKLRHGRLRKREMTGRCEGRKPLTETAPAAVALARSLRRKRPKGGRMSLRAIAAALAAAGYLGEKGKPYSAETVRTMTA